MAISFDPTENTLEAKRRYHRIAEEWMRPISRRCDEPEHEHERPTDFIDKMWAQRKEGAGGRLDGPTDGFVQVCVQAEELCWGDAGLYLRMPTAALGGSAVAAA